jgi:hypothetical protein
MTDELPDLTHRGQDKDELKRLLPLPYVCVRLGIPLNREGRALCPLHSDDTPSFYLYDHPADGAILWHCQPCGKGGDVFSLLMEVEHLNFPQAIERAAELLSELPDSYTAPVELSPPSTDGPEDWELDVFAGRQRAERAPGVLAVSTGLAAASTPVAIALDEMLRTQWGWGIDESGGVLMPHWTAEGKLTGCKVRYASGSRRSLPGSKYDALYGEWLGRRHQDCLITEGETDAVWAAFQTRVEGIGIDVFALPAGARRKLTAGQLKFIGSKRGTVYLALDPDEVGVAATRDAIELLNTAGITAIRVCCLPLGRDLRDARPVLKRLLAAARRPLPARGRVEFSPSGFIARTKDGEAYPVTNWTVEPVARLSGGESGFRVNLDYRAVVTPCVIKLADLASVNALGKWANRAGIQFLGSDAERKAISEWIEARASVTPEVFQAERVGVQDPPAEYAFAGRSVVYPTAYTGKLPWVYEPSPLTANVTDDILLPCDGSMNWRWLEDFLALSTPDVMHPLLAWLIAACRRPEVHEFPILFLSGSSGVGKSTLAKLACQLVGSKITVNLGGNTPFILLRKLSSSTSLPVFVDEWTRLSRKDTLEQLKGVIPMLYGGELAERGQADLTAMGYQLKAPTIIAGEDTFALDRERERIVTLRPSHTGQNQEALARLLGKPLERFGAWAHLWLAERNELPPMDSVTSTRPGYNRRVLEAGWETLHLMLEDAAQHIPDIPVLPELPDLSCFDVDASAESENVYEVALAEAAPLRDQGGIPLVWRDEQERGTWVRFQALIGLVKQRQLDLELPGGGRAMSDYFEERYGKLTQGRPTPPGSVTGVRAHLIPGLLIGEESAFNSMLTGGK